MQKKGFLQKGYTYQWEMMIVLYIHISKQRFLTGKVFTSTKACGFAKLIANKGGMNLQF